MAAETGTKEAAVLMIYLLSWCLLLAVLWWPKPAQLSWPGGWTVFGTMVIVMTWQQWIPVALAVDGACLLIWLEILQVILVRRFQNIGKVRAFNTKIFVLELLNLLVVFPVQVKECLHGQLGMLTQQVSLLAVTINGLVTGGLLLFWLITLLLPAVRPATEALRAIVVLGAGLHNGHVPPILASRLNTASQLWHQQPNATLVVTGARLRGDQLSEAAAMADYLFHHCQVPRTQIMLEEQARNTWQNLAFSSRLLQDHVNAKANDVAVVTSSFHLIRAWTYCRQQKLGWTLVAAPTPLGHQPMAVTRDYLGILRDHPWWSVMIMIVALIIVETLI